MSARTLLTAAAAALLALPVAASVTFSNTGTLSGWDNILREHQGTVDQVTNVVYNGSTAIKVTQTYDPSYTGRYHAEVHRTSGYKRGDTGFYGFAFRLSDAWQFSPAQSYNIGQFIGDFTDTGCDDWMPGSMVWLVGSQLYSRVKFGSVCNQKITTYPNLAAVSAGDWHRVEIQASWQSDSTGFYKIWFDGVKVLEKFNLQTTIDDSRNFEWHVGLYANGWHDDGGMKGTQPFRQVWYDNFAIGTTFGDADPAQFP